MNYSKLLSRMAASAVVASFLFQTACSRSSGLKVDSGDDGLNFGASCEIMGQIVPVTPSRSLNSLIYGIGQAVTWEAQIRTAGDCSGNFQIVTSTNEKFFFSGSSVYFPRTYSTANTQQIETVTVKDAMRPESQRAISSQSFQVEDTTAPVCSAAASPESIFADVDAGGNLVFPVPTSNIVVSSASPVRLVSAVYKTSGTTASIPISGLPAGSATTSQFPFAPTRPGDHLVTVTVEAANSVQSTCEKIVRYQAPTGGCTLTANPPAIAIGQPVTLTLQTDSWVQSAMLDGQPAAVPAYSRTIFPPMPGVLSSTATVSRGAIERQCGTSVTIYPPASISDLKLNGVVQNSITVNHNSTVSVDFTKSPGLNLCTINTNTIGSVPFNLSNLAGPNTLNYQIACSGPAGSATQNFSVTVKAPCTPSQFTAISGDPFLNAAVWNAMGMADPDSNPFRGDAPTATAICNRLGYNTVQTMSCPSTNPDHGRRCGWSSPGDNSFWTWNGTSFALTSASSNNTWLATLVCAQVCN